MDSHQAMGKIFNNLTIWRNLPKYQLERRADMFFGLYVKDIVETRLQTGLLSEIIIPEFPIRKDGPISKINLTEFPDKKTTEDTASEKPTQRTVNVDYALFAKDGRTVYFVELKTEMGSINDPQVEYLAKASRCNFIDLLNDLYGIKGSEKPKKYGFLYQLINKIKNGIDAFEDHVDVQVVYIQPEYKVLFEGFECIDFSAVYDFLENEYGAFPCLFMKYLEQWQIKAGEPDLSSLDALAAPEKPVRRHVDLPPHIGYLLHQLREEQGISLDLSTTPLEDSETFEMIRTGDTDNVPMLDSKIVQDYLVMFKPETIEELATAMAITTGGVIWSGGTQEFIERHHGRKKVEYDLPDLEPILKNTLGVIVYAEQVIKITEIIAGFSGTELTTLSFHLSENMQRRPFKVAIMQHKDRFLAGAKQKGYPDDIIEKLFSKISKFSRFDFYDACYAEDHAVAAYRCAYLKAHYPDEYNALFGIYSQPHPLIGYAQIISQKTNATTATLDHLQSDTDIQICGYIDNFRKMAVKNGGVVGLGVLEDQYGFVEISILQDVVTQHEATLESNQPVVISGILKKSDKAARIMVAGVEYLIQEA